ncbi:MAG: carboxypeptidase-like regulatory domain-containing protein [Acidobacteriota bacterium]|nr:carboxypeptidase-like regulatory domain-containing protein [Acidobacteriota bacterium]
MQNKYQQVSATITLLLLTLFLFHGTTLAQSGRGLMHGYVAFEDLSYNEVNKGAIHATVELRTQKGGDRAAYSAKTDQYGAYNFPSIAMGEYVLRISAPGYATYEAEIYIPSDFECKLAVMLKHEGRKGAKGNSK